MIKRLVEATGVGAVFFFAALLGLRVGLPGTSASPVWVAAGVSLAGALLFGRHVLVGVFIGAFLAEQTINPPALSLALALANVAEPLIAVTALQYFARGTCDLLHSRDTGVLLVFGAGLGAAVSATIGVGAIAVAQGLDPSALAVNWFTWWLGDASGLILVTPLIVYLVRLPYRKPTWFQLIEGLALVLGAAGVGLLALTGSIGRAWAVPGQFLIMVLIIWTAFILGPRISMLSVNVVAAVAVIAAVRLEGPFVDPSRNTTLLSLQAAMCGLAIATLILATMVEQRREALLVAEAVRDELEQKVHERTAQLEELATHDPLTGLMNRRAFSAVLDRAVQQARRAHPSALLFGDLDGFKSFNDARGHAAGDAALVAVAEVLRTEARGADAVARLGGDEFALLLDGASRAGAAAVSERIGERIGGLGVDAGVPMGVSIGVVSIDGALAGDELLAAADRAMYAAKATSDGSIVVVADIATAADPAGDPTADAAGG